MITVIALCVMGVLAISNTLVTWKPGTQSFFSKVSPYQGWIGMICALFGLVQLFRVGGYAPLAPSIFTLTWLVDGCLLVLLGGLFGVSVLKGSSVGVVCDKLAARLMPYQTKLGWGALAAAVWTLLLLLGCSRCGGSL